MRGAVVEPFELAIDADITLRLTTLDDAPAFFAFVERNRASLGLWLGWVERVQDVDGARAFIERYYKRWEHHAALMVNVWCGQTVAGNAVYRVIDSHNHKVEIGYALDEAFRGRGLATTVTRRLMDYAFDTLDMNRVEIHCAANNLASRAIPERLGFTHEGTAREATFVRGHYVDIEQYGMLKREWIVKRDAGAEF